MNNTLSSQLDYRSLKEITEILLRKGYDGQFLSQSEFPPLFAHGTVEQCLQRFIAECQRGNILQAQCRLSTELPDDFRSPPWFCRIIVEYNSKAGMRVGVLHLHKMGLQKPEKVLLVTHESLPAYKHLSKVAAPAPTWKTRVRSLLSKVKFKRSHSR